MNRDIRSGIGLTQTETKTETDNTGKKLRIEGVRVIGETVTTGMRGESAGSASLILHAGEITVLMGANGAGKTRFMETIAGLRAPESLAVHYGSESLWERRRLSARGESKLNEAALLAYAYSCQSPEEQLFLRTVREELDYTLRPYSSMTEADRNDRISAALQAVNWDGSWLERDPYAMSGGERRRTALSCLFAPPADWLLLDEPTAGLDAEGHALLGATLRRCASEGQGILLISHESDWAFELADRMLLLHADGSMRSCGKSELLANPQWLTEAGMEVPAWFSVAHLCTQLGIMEASVWDPSKLAEAIAGTPEKSQQSRTESTLGAVSGIAATGLAVSTSPTITPDSTNLSSPTLPSSPTIAPIAANAAAPTIAPARQPFALRASADKPSPIASFDARAVWLTYIVLSTFILQLNGWRSVGLAAVLVACAIYFGRIPLRRWRGAIRTIATFTAVISIFAGFTESRADSIWDVHAALLSLQSLLKPLIVMLLGFGLPIAVTPLRLRRSLEQLFSRFGRVPQWGTKMLLTITLLLRFVPVLLSEWERFSRISVARGKRVGNNWRGAIKKIQETALPFMLSLFRLGDQVADALESRGVGAQSHPTVLVTEVWQLRDTVLLLAGAAGGVLLWL
ncbi:ATP-binding cassette domain-containing protein [Paenibacillus rhizovicinus]|uniref:ATP-binding cassette domain-containing protein n=1 Tax=Paenibacillus rhizovicinus TaxID=2704463 RepID=A0A6C0P7P7_9BACL|nr:ATP-binding cassette domain-containing protein [Paenibacillus rhizovicinus]QHW34607.1 ATP-binding cassette domain-containing protein [Paenibacillus rhizovicinus]